jgi:hypothetical protein
VVSPLGHLEPFVTDKVIARMRDGEALTAELIGECLREAADEDNRRCLEVESRPELAGVIAEGLYNTLRHLTPDRPVAWNPKWLRCAKALGVEPGELRNLDYISWCCNNP